MVTTMQNESQVRGHKDHVIEDHYAPSASEEIVERPSPADFPAFLPWACTQLSVPVYINIISVVTEETPAKKDKLKNAKSVLSHQHSPENLDVKEKDESLVGLASYIRERDTVNIETTYKGNILVQLKFDKNKDIPQKIIKIIGLVIKFYPGLEKIIVNRGCSSHVAYEISNLLPISNITEVNLDNCFIAEANFHVLFDRPNSVKNISLARCGIGDTGIKKICQKLVYPLPASMTLVILNLSSNRITDTGAGHIAMFLRSNRCLKYLNLADNRMGDNGAKAILSTLSPFPLTEEERGAYKERYLRYLNNKNKLVKQIYSSMLKEKKRGGKLPEDKRKVKMEHELGHGISDPYILGKAETTALSACGEFLDPFSVNNTNVNDDKLFSNGNLALIYLNVAYNNLSLLTVNHLIKVFTYQISTSYNNAGITNIYLEGNPMPRSCDELSLLEALIDKRLGVSHRIHRFSQSKKFNVKK